VTRAEAVGAALRGEQLIDWSYSLKTRAEAAAAPGAEPTTSAALAGLQEEVAAVKEALSSRPASQDEIESASSSRSIAVDTRVQVRADVEAASAALLNMTKKAAAESVAKLTDKVLAAAAEAKAEGTNILVLSLTLEEGGSADNGSGDAEASANANSKKLKKLQTKLLKTVQKKAPGLAFLGLMIVPQHTEDSNEMCSCHCFAVVPKELAKETGLDASAWVMQTLDEHGGNGGGRGPIGMAQAKDIAIGDAGHSEELARALTAKARGAAAAAGGSAGRE
jgi:hypothetical protein